MMDLIEDDERWYFRKRGERAWCRSNLLIRHDGAVQIRCERLVSVAEAVVERDSGTDHRTRNLRFEMLARDDDDDA